MGQREQYSSHVFDALPLCHIFQTSRSWEWGEKGIGINHNLIVKTIFEFIPGDDVSDYDKEDN